MSRYHGNQNSRKKSFAFFPVGMSRHILARTYMNMIYRCFNQNHPAYSDYGGRGITVCERWLPDEQSTGQGFLNFISDMGPRPTDKTKKGYTAYSIERRNNNGNYEPENCYWATWREQAGSQRKKKDTNLLLDENGGVV